MNFISREELLECLIDRYQHLIFSICYKMTADYFAAEDLAQETFLTAYEKFTLFDGKNEKAWICRIAVNKCLDYQKHSGRRNVPTEDSYFTAQIGEKASPEEILLEKEVMENLKCACKRLKPPYDEIALEHYYCQVSVEEMAKKRGKNPKTIQTQIYRARGMLRKIMKDPPKGERRSRP